MSDKKRPFARNLKIKRAQLRLTQQQLADMLSEKIYTVQAWEDDRAQPPVSKLAKIAKALAIDDMITFITEYL